MSRLLCISLIFSCLSCAKEEASSTLLRISSGTSYGFCVGYCEHELEIKKDTTVFTQRPTRQQDLEELICSTKTKGSQWADLEALLSPAFFDLDEIIGCPDCADGGREFIEIETTTERHRIELDATLKAIYHPIIQKLREIRDPYLKAGGCPE